MRRAKFPLEKSKKKKPKIKSKAALEKELKSVMYPLVKKRDGPECISCPKKSLIGQDWHAGHYVKAEVCNLPVRYDERNINSQCSYCNLYLRGNTVAYRKAMIRKYGEAVVEELESTYNNPLPTNFDYRGYLQDRIAYYKSIDHLTPILQS